MFSSKAPLWSLFCALLCLQCVVGANLPHGSLTQRSSLSKTEKQHEPRANAIALSHTSPTLVPAVGTARSIGVRIHPLTTPILPQALTNVLVQTFHAAYIELGPKPDGLSGFFRHTVRSQLPKFNVEFQLVATGNQTGDFMLTNSRIADTLSLLGYEYANRQNVSNLVEYSFQIVIDTWMEPEVVIATGSIRNILSGSRRAPMTAKV